MEIVSKNRFYESANIMFAFKFNRAECMAGKKQASRKKRYKIQLDSRQQHCT